jgi:hypothetical protein
MKHTMITAEIKLPEKDAEMILWVISKLGGKVKVIDPNELKLSPAAKKMKKDLEQAFKEVKLHQEGKIRLKTMQEYWMSSSFIHTHRLK